MNIEKLQTAMKGFIAGSLVPQPVGSVLEVAGTIVQIAMTGAKLGDVVAIESEIGEIACEVVGFRDQTLLAIPLSPAKRIKPGAAVRLRGAMSTITPRRPAIGGLYRGCGIQRRHMCADN